jgi:general secretion pathway protein F/type IV pilus assembly protein PilC
MPLYRFKAISPEGKSVVGTIDADHLQDAKIKLLRRQVTLIHLTPLSTKELQLRLKKRELLIFTREISRLLQAGLPLFEVLSALEEKYRTQKIHPLFLDLCDQIKNGHSFSQALAAHPQIFDVLYTAMIANAEKTGRLAAALEELATLLMRQIQLQKQLLSALLYPALLASFCCIVLASLFFFVIPSLQELFEGRALHPFTLLVFTCSEWACRLRPLLCVAGLFLLLGTLFLFFSSRGKMLARRWMGHLPWIRQLSAKVAFVRFCRAMASLLEGGLPAMSAFAQARAVMRHPVLERVIAEAEEKISQGTPLHVPFQNHPLIPSLVPRMLAIAEQGGKLPQTMHQIAQIYEEELETWLTHFTTLAQPLLLLILGGVIGFVLLAVLLPLTDVSSFAQS